MNDRRQPRWQQFHVNAFAIDSFRSFSPLLCLPSSSCLRTLIGHKNNTKNDKLKCRAVFAHYISLSIVAAIAISLCMYECVRVQALNIVNCIESDMHLKCQIIDFNLLTSSAKNEQFYCLCELCCAVRTIYEHKISISRFGIYAFFRIDNFIARLWIQLAFFENANYKTIKISL